MHPSSKFPLQAVNRSSITTYGDLSPTLDVGLRRASRWIFIIADISNPIFGADFLPHFGFLVDVRNLKLIDSTTNLSVRGILSSSPSISPMFVKADSQAAFKSLLDQFPDLTRPVYNGAKMLELGIVRPFGSSSASQLGAQEKPRRLETKR